TGQPDRVRFVVTAGPTREAIDPVRFISNRSSGKMGYAIAEAALARKHQVTLISGPASIAPPPGATNVSITTSDELHDAVHRAVDRCDVLVMCAAVSDYKPAARSTRKMKKRKTPFALKLIPTRDILASLPKRRSYLVVGFAAETHSLRKNAQKKLRAKNCDAIVANDVSSPETGMESDENEVTIFFRDGGSEEILRAPKKIIARELVKIIAKMWEKSLTKKS
ncbi:MAG TPA: phosphopantothenoylcysteine decarboxylase, partial [Chthoniobacterales bacterium]